MRFVLALVLLLASCSRGPYWQPTSPPGLVTAVLATPDVDVVCRAKSPVLGCYDRSTGVIYLKLGMDSVMHSCVLHHEYRHAAGDEHPGFDEPQLGVDCGDGTIV
jgi:hypothetical protein